MVVAHKNAPVNFNPQDFVVYTANSDFGAGQDLGNGNFVISNSIDAFVNIHNLEANTSYHFAVFEYNGFNQPLYRLPAATGTATTLTALPVKLSRWEATPSGNKVILQWTTSAEINASHFVIERSADGTRFSPLATVPANGNTQGDASYSGEDPDPLGGRSYYRLKMMDVDGRFEYADVRTVLFSSNKKPIILGNPVRNIVELVTPNAGGRSAWQIINRAGQIMRKGFASPGRTVIDISTLNAGEYWLRSDSGERPQVLAFIKL
jgi:hypothetical protein